MNCCRHRMNWIRPPEIRPTMTTRARHPDTKPATTQSLMRDTLKSAHVDSDELTFAAVRPRRRAEEMSYSAQISLTFLANICDGYNRLSKSQSHFASSAEGPQQGDQAATVVGNARYEQCLLFPAQLEGCFTRKNSVKVRANDKRRAAEIFKRRDDMSKLVPRWREADLPQFFSKRVSPRSLTEGRRWNERQTNLVRFDLRFLLGNKPERALDTRIRDDPFYLLAHGLLNFK